MNGYALGWLDQALRLEDELVLAHVLRDELGEENRELRGLISNVLFAVQQGRATQRQELLDWAAGEIETRWPGAGQRE